MLSNNQVANQIQDLRLSTCCVISKLVSESRRSWRPRHGQLPEYRYRHFLPYSNEPESLRLHGETARYASRRWLPMMRLDS